MHDSHINTSRTEMAISQCHAGVSHLSLAQAKVNSALSFPLKQINYWFTLLIGKKEAKLWRAVPVCLLGAIWVCAVFREDYELERLRLGF